ncbi:hypothetical protein AB0J21_28490 [Streptomyces sp. NPDC049954]|uniref:hypothetical protein n=1 Tax=Streptomyces sp. NPDC049954 TaxID=3155779 RepID=UPI00343D4F92
MPDEHNAFTAPARTPGEPSRQAAARQARAALLSELPLDALPDGARRHAEHLTAALHTVTVPRPGDTASSEPPEPVLAAFRAAHGQKTARAQRAADPDAVGAPARRTGARGCGRGLGPGSWGRSTRLAAAGVLSIGMIGGVAVAAGAGALTSPFPSPVDQRAPLRHGTAAPVPAGSPDEGQEPRALSTDEPTAPTTRRPPSTTSSASPATPAPSTSPSPDGPAGPSPAGTGGGGDVDGVGRHAPDVLRPCQDQRRGRPLDALTLRALARAAHGAAAVPEFCRHLLGLPPGPWQKILLPPGSPIPLTPGDGIPAPEPPAPSPATTGTAPGSLPTYGYGGVVSPTPQEPGTPQVTGAETGPASPAPPTGPTGETGSGATPSAAPTGDGPSPAADPAADPAS